MEIRYYLGLLRRWWWLLVLSVVVTAVPAYFITESITPTYRASATVFVNVQTGTGTMPADLQASERLVQTYSEMAHQPVVVEEVRDRLELNQSAGALRDQISVQPRRDTQLFDINVIGDNPHQLRDIANTTAEVFIEQQQQYLPEGVAGDEAIRLAQPALVPGSPIAPNAPQSITLAAIAGLFIAGAGILLYEYLDDTLKSPEQLESATGISTLGIVAFNEEARGHDESPALAAERANAPAMEAYRLIRTNLDFMTIEHPARSILITSSNAGEGKTTTIANLAVVMAQAGKRVLLVDADLRKPALHRVFGVSNSQGLTNLLLNDQIGINSVIQASGFNGLRVLTSGPLPPNPTELLVSEAMIKLLKSLQDEADIILMDSPPALAVADSVILAGRSGNTIFVIDSRKTRPDTARRAVETLARSGTRMLGGVLNKLTRSSEGYYYYYGYYGYYGAPGDLGGGDDPPEAPSAEPESRPESPSGSTSVNQIRPLRHIDSVGQSDDDH